MRSRLAVLSLGAALGALACPALAQEAAPATAPAAPAEVRADEVIDFAAETLAYDEAAQTILATGNVIVVRGGYRLRADEVEYDQATGQVEARGNVIIIDPGGNQAFGDRVQLTESLRDGAAENMLLVLEDGGRLAARSGTRIDGVSTLERAIYSPCTIAEDADCPREPVWQIKAVRVVHDPVRNRIRYKDAYFEFFGIPIFYAPTFSHTTGGSGNATGLLVPSVRLDKSLGLSVETPYFVAFSPSRDLTITPTLYTDVNPALGFEYRHLTETGPFRIGGIGTYASTFDTGPAGLVNDRNDFRGYLFANGRFQHSTRWRSTFGMRLTTDDTFMRRYDISRDDNLRNFYTLERFAPRSYLTIEGWAFQGLRLTDTRGQSPIVLPAVDFLWRPDVRPLGGGITVRANSLALTRTDGQDTRRALASARWDLTRLTTLGQRVTATAMLRGDLYNVDDSALAQIPAYAGRDGWEARALPAAAIDVEWPFAGPALGGIQMFTPRVQLVASGPGNNERFPNEDARAIDLEDLNLFSLNRFHGFDRWEGGVRVTYGARWTLDRPRWRAEFEGGQSYRLDDKTNIAPAGTGLDGNFSDFVGRSTIRWGSNLDLTHRFRLDKNSFEVRRNEIDATFGTARTYGTVSYVRLNRDISFEDLADREELRVGGRLAFARWWSVFGSAIVDLTGADEIAGLDSDGYEPVRHRIGVAYEDECLEIGVTWRRDYTEDRDFRRGNTFLLSFSLKNLGR